MAATQTFFDRNFLTLYAIEKAGDFQHNTDIEGIIRRLLESDAVDKIIEQVPLDPLSLFLSLLSLSLSLSSLSLSSPRRVRFVQDLQHDRVAGRQLAEWVERRVQFLYGRAVQQIPQPVRRERHTLSPAGPDGEL